LVASFFKRLNVSSDNHEQIVKIVRLLVRSSGSIGGIPNQAAAPLALFGACKKFLAIEYQPAKHKCRSRGTEFIKEPSGLSKKNAAALRRTLSPTSDHSCPALRPQTPAGNKMAVIRVL
jgi:hypothetical protein